jgi:hypothetical protein
MPLNPDALAARIALRVAQLRVLAATAALRPDRHVCYVLDYGEPVAWPYSAPIALDPCRLATAPGAGGGIRKNRAAARLRPGPSRKSCSKTCAYGVQEV